MFGHGQDQTCSFLTTSNNSFGRLGKDIEEGHIGMVRRLSRFIFRGEKVMRVIFCNVKR